LKSNIEISTNEKKSSKQLLLSTILDVDRIITILLQVFVDVRKDYLRLFSLTKTIIISNLIKIDRKEVVKILNTIRESINNIIIKIVEKYFLLVFLNLILKNFVKTKNLLLYIRFYTHNKNLDIFLKKEFCILKKQSTFSIFR